MDRTRYETWDDFCDAEFGGVRLRLPVEERREAVAELTRAGLAPGAIGSALGVGRTTVRRDLSGWPNGHPDEDLREWVESRPVDPVREEIDRWREMATERGIAHVRAEREAEREERRVTGRDGKSYPATRRAVPQPPPPSPELQAFEARSRFVRRLSDLWLNTTTNLLDAMREARETPGIREHIDSGEDELGLDRLTRYVDRLRELAAAANPLADTGEVVARGGLPGEVARAASAACLKNPRPSLNSVITEQWGLGRERLVTVGS